MHTHMISWVLFNLLILVLLAIDLGVFNRKAHEIRVKEAMIWSGIWISISLLFNVGVFFWLGKTEAVEFLTGYVLEKSLSVDNIFVFLLIFTYFRVPAKYQHKVLFWGVLGALIMRALFIVAGITLIKKFEWIIYFFGVFLVVTGIKLAFEKDKKIDPAKNPVLRVFRRLIPISDEYDGAKFITKVGGKHVATPMLVVLIVIETTDVVFAVDSIPAILAVTVDPFIVYSSNVFAILGLRALYFALAGIMRIFHYLHYGLSFILSFVGVKMLVSHYYKIPTLLALGIIGFVLLISILASILFPKSAELEF